MTVGEKIKKYRELMGMTQSELAKRMEVSDRAISTWELGTREPRMGSIAKLANIFGVKVSDLIDDAPGETFLIESAQMIPVIGTVYAGVGGLAQEEFMGMEPAFNIRCTDEYRYFLVKGDSMSPDIRHGDLALVRLQPTVESGDYAVVIINGEEGLIKKVQFQKNSIALISINPEYQPRVFIGSDMAEVKIWGKVIETKRKYI